MPEQFVVNSLPKLQGFMAHAERLFKEHKVVRFTWRAGKDRSLDQNRMFFELYSRIGLQLFGGHTEDARRQAKLHYGIPILRRDNDEFRDTYDRLVKPRSYEEKLELMGWLPVTSLFGVKQGSEYINTLLDQYTLKGVDFGHLLDWEK